MTTARTKLEGASEPARGARAGARLAAAALAAALLAGCEPEPREPDVPGCDPGAEGWTVWVANQAMGIDAVLVLRVTEDVAGTPSAEVLATIPAGRAPHNLAFGPDGRFAYVANLSTPLAPGTVTVIDTASYEVVATVEAGIEPHSVRVTPDGAFAWVANIRSDDVTVIDTATLEALPEPIAVGDGPTQIAFAAGGAKAFVSNGSAGTVSIVDVAARRETSTIATGEGSMGLALTSDGRFVIETEPLDDRISVIDAATDERVEVLTFGDTLFQPHGLATAGNEVLVTTGASESLLVVDAITFEKKAALVVAGRPMLLAASPDCRRAYLTLQDAAALAVVDVGARTLLGTIDLGEGNVHGVAVLPSAPPAGVEP